MSSIPPPIGLPFGTGIAFDATSVIAAVTALVMLGGLALLLWAVRARDRVTYRTGAVIRVPTPRGDRRADVERRSLGEAPTRVEGDKRRPRLVA